MHRSVLCLAHIKPDALPLAHERTWYRCQACIRDPRSTMFMAWFVGILAVLYECETLLLHSNSMSSSQKVTGDVSVVIVVEVFDMPVMVNVRVPAGKGALMMLPFAT